MRGLLVAGTASDAGKSVVVAGLCRWLARRGIKAAPFKAQNMALNSAVTRDGAEIGRAQAAQAAAARVAPEAAMNPILLKPSGERTSQVVVMGQAVTELDAGAYQQLKPRLRTVVLDALASLADRFEVVICEGAGSPAEINLRAGDLVNMGLARAAGLPVVVVGDIDRGGVFASLFGTLALLDAAEWPGSGCCRAPWLGGVTAAGYEIRHGRTRAFGGAPVLESDDGDLGCRSGSVVGVAWHGIFEGDAFRRAFLGWVAAERGLDWLAGNRPFAAVREERLDALGDLIAEHADTAALDRLLDQGAPPALPFVPPGPPS